MLSRRSLMLGAPAAFMLAEPAGAGFTLVGRKRPGSKLRALCIGIDDYSAVPKLARAVSDARAIAERLGKYGYQAMLVDNPGAKQLEAALQQFSAGIDQSTVSFVFFAGHGIQVEGANYLLPADVKTGSAEAVLDSSLPLSSLLAKVAARSPFQNIAVIDACRDDPLAESGTGPKAKGIASVMAPNGSYIVYSAGSGETALDSLSETDQHPNGVFTRTLLKHLSENVTFDKIVKTTRSDVSRLASSVGHDQHPAIYDQGSSERTLAGREAGVAAANRFPPGAAPLSRSGYAPSECLILSQGDYSGGDLRPPLFAPHDDAVFVRKAWIDADQAAPRLLMNPNLAMARAAIDIFAKSPSDTLMIYYSGHGDSYLGDTMLSFPDERIFSDFREAAANGLSLTEVAKALSRPGRHVALVVDAGIFIADEKDKEGPGLVYRMLRDPSAVEREFGALSILYSSSLLEGEPSADSLEDQPNRSPFALAVANALGRGSTTMPEFAAVVTSEVRAMTKGAQVPMLLATPAASEVPLFPKPKPLAPTTPR